MTKEIPTGVIVAAYNEEKAAFEAYEYIRDSRTVANLFYQVAAVVWRAEDGDLHIKEPDDKSTGAGIGAGAVLGGMLGTLAGPAGIVLGASAGAAVGDWQPGAVRIPDERLQEIGAGSPRAPRLWLYCCINRMSSKPGKPWLSRAGRSW